MDTTKQITKGLIYLILATLIYFFFTAPLLGKLSQAKKKLDEQKAKLAEIEDLNTVLGELNRQFGAVSPQAQKINIALPTDKQSAELVLQFSAMASQNGLNLRQVSFSEIQNPKTKSGYVPFEASLTLGGSYEGLKAFLVALEQNLRILDVKLLQFAPSIQRSGLDINILLQTYYQG